MGIKLGDISPLAGAISGKGLFGKGLAKLADSGAGMLVPMSSLAQNRRDKNTRRAAMEMQRKGVGMRGRPMVEDIMMAEEAPAGAMMRKGGKVKKPVKKMAKGGSTASKRADGCCSKGKTKGRFV